MATFGIAHLRLIGRGQPGWGETQRWHMAGADPSYSVYDRPSTVSDDGLHRRYRGGTLTMHELLPPGEPTMTRRARVSALQSSLPAASFFQSYTGAGTGRSWSPGSTPQLQHTGLHQNFNPHMMGAAELHPATTYDPFPSPSALYPKVV